MFKGHGYNSHRKFRSKERKLCSRGLRPSFWSVTRFTGPQTAFFDFFIVFVQNPNVTLPPVNKWGGQYQLIERLKNLPIFSCDSTCAVAVRKTKTLYDAKHIHFGTLMLKFSYFSNQNCLAKYLVHLVQMSMEASRVGRRVRYTTGTQNSGYLDIYYHPFYTHTWCEVS